MDLFIKDTKKIDISQNDKPKDAADFIVEEKVIKNRYLIYPTNGRHPMHDYSEKDPNGILHTSDFPYILDTNYRCRGIKKRLNISLRDTIEYPYVQLTKEKGGAGKHICIHKLVARAFLDPGNLDPYDDKTVVNHINKNPWDYRLSNLEFVTRSENGKDNRVRKKQFIYDLGKFKGFAWEQ